MATMLALTVPRRLGVMSYARDPAPALPHAVPAGPGVRPSDPLTGSRPR